MRRLVEQQAVDQIGAVGQVPRNPGPGDAVGHRGGRHRGDEPVSHSLQAVDHGADDIFRPRDGSIGTGEARAVGLGRTVDENLGFSVGQYDRERIPFDRREIGGVAQVVALPRVSADQNAVEPRSPI